MRSVATSLFSRKKTRETTCAIGDVLVTLRSDLEHVYDDFVSLYPRASKGENTGRSAIQIEVRRSGRTMLGQALIASPQTETKSAGAIRAMAYFR